MKNLWKVTVWALALLSALFVLWGCGDDEPEETPDEGTHTCAGVAWVIEADATCTAEGSKKFVCSCGKTVKTEKIPLAAHTYDDANDESCNVCGFVGNSACRHSSQITLPGYAATCEQTGLTDGKKCSVCGVTLAWQTEISPIPHTEETVPGRAATCEQTGLTDGKKCSVCGEMLVAQTEIPIDPDAHNVVNETCTLCGCSIGTEIRTVADLRNIDSNLNANYILMNDLDLGGMEWTPIGTDYNNPFTGTFDGNGHVIKNFKITGEMQYAGLFRINEGTIQNIGLEDFTIDVSDSGNVYAGGLVGYNNGTITNCYATGDVSATARSTSTSSYVYASAGGLVGENHGTITNSYATGEVSASADDEAYAGGLVGKNWYGTITNCYATGAVSASSTSSYASTSASAGGLVGYNYKGTITNSYATGAVSATASGNYAYAYAGGLVGLNEYGTITNCYATGDVSASSTSTSSSAYARAGGLVGENYYSGTITNCYATGDVSATASSTRTSSSANAYAGGLVGENYYSGTITNCYATGDIGASSASSSAYAGGLVGYNDDGTVINCYRYHGQSFTVTKNGTITHSATNTIGAEASIGNLQSKAWVEANLWKAEIEIWDFDSGYPTLDYESIEVVKQSIVEISTKEDLLKLQAGGLLGNYKLMADIDLGGMEWQPIAIFFGTFDGNGHVIENFKITGNRLYAGLFGRNEGTIQNLGLEDFTIDVSYSGIIYAGGLVGYNNGTITNCYATGDVSASSTRTSSSANANAGGLVGYKNSGTITNCYATGDVSATARSTSTSSYVYASAGGLVGENYAGIITNCYATGDVSASITSTNSDAYAYAGGLVGYNVFGTITNCYATGDVSASSTSTSYDAYANAGGLVGLNGGPITNCYRYSSQRFTVTVNGTTTYEATNTLGTATDMATLQSVNFRQNTLGWSADDWNFANGAHPTLK